MVAVPVHKTRVHTCSLCRDRNDRTTAKLLYPARLTEEGIKNQRSCTPPPGTHSSFVALQEAGHEAPGDCSMPIKTFVGNGPKKRNNKKEQNKHVMGNLVLQWNSNYLERAGEAVQRELLHFRRSLHFT